MSPAIAKAAVFRRSLFNCEDDLPFAAAPKKAARVQKDDHPSRMIFVRSQKPPQEENKSFSLEHIDVCWKLVADTENVGELVQFHIKKARFQKPFRAQVFRSFTIHHYKSTLLFSPAGNGADYSFWSMHYAPTKTKRQTSISGTKQR